MQYHERGGHKDDERKRCAAQEYPTWDQLNHQQIRLLLQLHSQHFWTTHPHRWSHPEKNIAIEYTNRFVLNADLRKDFMGALLQKLQRASASIITQAKSKAKRPPRPYWARS